MIPPTLPFNVSTPGVVLLGENFGPLTAFVLAGVPTAAVAGAAPAGSGSSWQLTLDSPAFDTYGYKTVEITTQHATAIDVLHFYVDICLASTYRVGDRCLSCPVGATCPGGPRLWPKPGYWNAGENSGFVTECLPPADRCQGGTTSAKCGPGYSGVQCQKCAHDYYALGHACVACGNAAVSYLLILVDGVLFVGYIWIALLDSSTALQLYAFVLVMVQSVRAALQSSSIKLPPALNWLQVILSASSRDSASSRPECLDQRGSAVLTRFTVLVGMITATIVILLFILYVMELWARSREHRRSRCRVASVALVAYEPPDVPSAHRRASEALNSSYGGPPVVHIAEATAVDLPPVPGQPPPPPDSRGRSRRSNSMDSGKTSSTTDLTAGDFGDVASASSESVAPSAESPSSAATAATADLITAEVSSPRSMHLSAAALGQRRGRRGRQRHSKGASAGAGSMLRHLQSTSSISKSTASGSGLSSSGPAPEIPSGASASSCSDMFHSASGSVVANDFSEMHEVVRFEGSELETDDERSLAGGSISFGCGLESTELADLGSSHSLESSPSNPLNDSVPIETGGTKSLDDAIAKLVAKRIRGVAILLYSMHFVLASATFPLLYCDRLPGTRTVLIAAPSVECFRGYHTPAFVIAALVILGVTIGFPVALSVLLRRLAAREMLSDPHWVLALGALYTDCRPGLYLTAPMWMAFLAVQAAIIVLLARHPVPQVLVGLCVCLPTVVYFGLRQPYRRAAANFLPLSVLALCLYSYALNGFEVLGLAGERRLTAQLTVAILFVGIPIVAVSAHAACRAARSRLPVGPSADG